MDKGKTLCGAIYLKEKFSTNQACHLNDGHWPVQTPEEFRKETFSQLLPRNLRHKAWGKAGGRIGRDLFTNYFVTLGICEADVRRKTLPRRGGGRTAKGQWREEEEEGDCM